MYIKVKNEDARLYDMTAWAKLQNAYISGYTNLRWGCVPRMLQTSVVVVVVVVMFVVHEVVSDYILF